MNQIFICEHSKPSHQYDLFWKYTRYISFLCKRSEPVLPYHLFSNNFFASTTSPPPVFIQKLHCALISNVKEVNPILFCESSEPTRPCDLLFLWILHGMWELSIWRASNLYSKVQRANQPLWSVFAKIVWHMRFKYEWGESNPFLHAQGLIHPIDLLLRKLYNAWVKCKRGESNPFCKRSKPTRPNDLFFVKIVLCMRVNIKRWIQLLFVYTASPPSPITSFMWKLHGLWVKCKSYQYFARNEGKEINKKAKPALTYNWTWIFLVGLYQNLQKIGHLITQ